MLILKVHEHAIMPKCLVGYYLSFQYVLGQIYFSSSFGTRKEGEGVSILDLHRHWKTVLHLELCIVKPIFYGTLSFWILSPRIKSSTFYKILFEHFGLKEKEKDEIGDSKPKVMRTTSPEQIKDFIYLLLEFLLCLMYEKSM